MMPRWLHRLLRRPGVQRHTVGEYEREERQILADWQDGPFDWPAHEVDDEFCGCRGCHDVGIGEFTPDAVDSVFWGMVDTPSLKPLSGRGRIVRRWKP